MYIWSSPDLFGARYMLRNASFIAQHSNFWQAWESCIRSSNHLVNTKQVYANTNVWVRGLPSKQVRYYFAGLCRK